MSTFIFPTVKRVTSNFNKNRLHPTTGNISYHSGTDFAESGYHEIKATAYGRVVKISNQGTYGTHIMLSHQVNGERWTSVYAHLRKGSVTVKDGQVVEQGQVIGVMGDTGRVTGQHLHFELHKGTWNSARSNGVNPLDYLGRDLDNKIKEDGSLGPATTSKAQEVYKLKKIDGIISGQPKNKSTLNIPAVEFGEGGSNLIEAMQKEFGVPSKYRDRIITDPSMLVEYMQEHYGTTKDRYISMPSNVIKKWQKALNSGKRK